MPKTEAENKTILDVQSESSLSLVKDMVETDRDSIETYTLLVEKIAIRAAALRKILPKEHAKNLLALEKFQKNHPTPEKFKHAFRLHIVNGACHIRYTYFMGALEKRKKILKGLYTFEESLEFSVELTLLYVKLQSIKYAFSRTIDTLLEVLSKLPENMWATTPVLIDLIGIKTYYAFWVEKQERIQMMIDCLLGRASLAPCYTFHVHAREQGLVFDGNRMPILELSKRFPKLYSQAEKLINTRGNEIVDTELDDFEKIFSEAVTVATSIDATLVNSKVRRVRYFNQSLERGAVFNPGFCEGGALIWTRQFPAGRVLVHKSPDRRKVTFRTYQDLHDFPMTDALFVLQNNQGQFSLSNMNNEHILFDIPQKNGKGLAEIQKGHMITDQIIEQLSTISASYYIRNGATPVILVSLHSTASQKTSGHVLAFKLVDTKEGPVWRFFDFNYGEFEADTLQVLRQWLPLFFSKTSYGKWCDSFKMRVLIPRNLNQRRLLNQFHEYIARAPHRMLLRVHQEAHQDLRNALHREALNIAVVQIVKKWDKEIFEKGLLNYRGISCPTLEDRLSLLLLFPILANTNFEDRQPGELIEYLRRALKLLEELKKEDSKDWRWNVLIAAIELEVVKLLFKCGSKAQYPYQGYLASALGRILSFPSNSVSRNNHQTILQEKSKVLWEKLKKQNMVSYQEVLDLYQVFYLFTKPDPDKTNMIFCDEADLEKHFPYIPEKLSKRLWEMLKTNQHLNTIEEEADKKESSEKLRSVPLISRL